MDKKLLNLKNNTVIEITDIRVTSVVKVSYTIDYMDNKMESQTLVIDDLSIVENVQAESLLNLCFDILKEKLLIVDSEFRNDNWIGTEKVQRFLVPTLAIVESINEETPLYVAIDFMKLAAIEDPTIKMKVNKFFTIIYADSIAPELQPAINPLVESGVIKIESR